MCARMDKSEKVMTSVFLLKFFGQVSGHLSSFFAVYTRSVRREIANS